MTNLPDIATQLEQFFDENVPSDEQHQCIVIAFQGTDGSDQQTAERIQKLKMCCNSMEVLRMLNDWLVEGF